MIFNQSNDSSVFVADDYDGDGDGIINGYTKNRETLKKAKKRQRKLGGKGSLALAVPAYNSAFIYWTNNTNRESFLLNKLFASFSVGLINSNNCITTTLLTVMSEMQQ